MENAYYDYTQAKSSGRTTENKVVNTLDEAMQLIMDDYGQTPPDLDITVTKCVDINTLDAAITSLPNRIQFLPPKNVIMKLEHLCLPPDDVSEYHTPGGHHDTIKILGIPNCDYNLGLTTVASYQDNINMLE